MKKITHAPLALIICIILAILPFFWIKPGEVNMGGDGSSVYFYDPINLIKNVALYKMLPYGTGPIEVRYFYLPFAGLLAFLKLFLPLHILSILHTGIKLAVGFISVYAIVKELLGKFKDSKQKIEVIALLTGIFYILCPLLLKDDRFINPIPSHDQVFLNPLVFYLVLKYFLTHKIRYIWFTLLLTVVFSTSFSYSAAPAIFAFYPLALLFLILYVRFILKRPLPVKGILIGIVFFALLHIFHLGPELANLFDSASDANNFVFNSSDYKEQVTYFYGVISFTSVAKSILLPSVSGGIWLLLTFVSPLIILLGFIRNKERSKVFLLTGIAFLITLFLISAKISQASIKLYELFFLYIPGFGMFRNFYIQWLFVFTFFYALLFGLALFSIYESLGKTKTKITTLVLFIYLLGSSWTFIRGDQFNLAHVQTANVKRLVAVDPEYEKMLAFIRDTHTDGKLLEFPFSDFNFQVLHGTGDGAYVGTPTIGQLTGVKEFAGYWNIAPYSEAFLQLSKARDYAKLYKIFGLLNIRYIFYNADPRIYDSSFVGRPFEYTRQLLPASQKEYAQFIKPLVGEKIFENGPYNLYLTNESSYIPHMYIPKSTRVYRYNPKYDRFYHAASSFLVDENSTTDSADKRVAYIEKKDCLGKSFLQALCDQDTVFEVVPKIYFEKVNPLKYRVKITNITQPFLLVFSDAFHKDWKVFFAKENVLKKPDTPAYFNGDIEEGKSESIFFDEKTFETDAMKNVAQTQHISVNAYANAWYITPKDINMQQDATFILEMSGQRLFYVCLLISSLAFGAFIFWGLILILTRKY